MTLLLNNELICRVKLCLVSVFPDIFKDCPKVRNFPKIFLISFENVGPDVNNYQCLADCLCYKYYLHSRVSKNN